MADMHTYYRDASRSIDPVMSDLGRHIARLDREDARERDIECYSAAIYGRMQSRPTCQEVLDALAYADERTVAAIIAARKGNDLAALGAAINLLIDNAFSDIANAEAVRMVERLEKEAAL